MTILRFLNLVGDAAGSFPFFRDCLPRLEKRKFLLRHHQNEIAQHQPDRQSRAKGVVGVVTDDL